MAKIDNDLTHLQDRVRTALQSNRIVVLRWYKPDATGLERWTRNALDDPHSAAARIPGRLACRLLGRHNWTCIGSPSPRHPARW